VKRIAFLSPLPPAPTGVADYSAEVGALLAERHAIDFYDSSREIDRGRLPSGCHTFHADTFLERHRQRPYDLALYQMGNGMAHAFLYDLVARVPGLLVLHDLVLHHARARTFLESDAARAYAAEPWNAVRRDAARVPVDQYRAEVEYCYPGQGDRIVAAHLQTTGSLLAYAYPLFKIPVEASRVTAVHNDFMADAIRTEVPDAHVVRVPQPARHEPVADGRLAALRARHGLAQGDFVVGVFGLLTREKRVLTVARAVARAAWHLPNLRLLLVGSAPEAADLEKLLADAGVRERTIVTGRVPWEELPAYMTLPQAVVQLRYPSARETSAALLRVLAQGRPAIISDLAHQADIPDDAVLRADVTDEEGAVTRGILRLAGDPRLAERLGRNARAFVEREHAPARTRDAYLAAIDQALASPDPAARPWPAHWSSRREPRDESPGHERGAHA
jgi:glycosyltransferase involved in cell wall biosynthesis